MEAFHSSEKGVQIVISLLKKYGIKKIIASPGGTNVTFVATIQQDPFFEIYSCVDERSAAYIACGLSAESGEPVVLSCTGATSSRNYMPGLTEAYYRKLPIIAITSTQDLQRQGNLIAQNIDRSVHPNDIIICSVHIPYIKNDTDINYCVDQVNKVLHKTKSKGGGPVHINLTTHFSSDYISGLVPDYKRINYHTCNDNLPPLPNGRIGIFIGSHNIFSETETLAIDNFCKANNAIVFCDHTSGYKGKYAVNFALIAAQCNFETKLGHTDLLIHIGEISGDYASLSGVKGKNVWRVNKDGEIRNTFGNLTDVFEMSEETFFHFYSKEKIEVKREYFDSITELDKQIRSNILDLPLSNIYCAYKLHDKLPHNSIIYFGILNSLRAWNFFNIDKTIHSYCNVGGFGIDGGLSSLVGASLASPNKICFGVFGDLGFFYDINVLGNRHIGKNIRILLINNGHGQEFRNSDKGAGFMGDDTEKFIAAAGHNGNKSRYLIKHFAEDLGFQYIYASTKDEFDSACQDFLTPKILEKPIIFEVFTNTEEETKALFLMETIKVDSSYKRKQIIKGVMEDIKDSTIKFAKHLVGQY